MSKKNKEFHSLIRSDLEKNYLNWSITDKNYKLLLVRAYLISSIFRQIYWIRKRYIKRTFYSRIRVKMLQEKNKIYIPNIKIGGGLQIVHPGPIYLSAREIGDNFRVYHLVTVGNNKGRGHPKIGNNVTCYAGSCVVGPIEIGDNCEIGANAFVNHDLPPSSLVINECINKIKQNK